MYNLGIIDQINQKGIEILKNNKNFKFEIITDLSKNNLLKKLPTFDGITLRRGVLDQEILSKCKKLKVISRHGVGYDNVDTNFLKKIMKFVNMLKLHFFVWEILTLILVCQTLKLFNLWLLRYSTFNILRTSSSISLLHFKQFLL